MDKRCKFELNIQQMVSMMHELIMYVTVTVNGLLVTHKQTAALSINETYNRHKFMPPPNICSNKKYYGRNVQKVMSLSTVTLDLPT